MGAAFERNGEFFRELFTGNKIERQVREAVELDQLTSSAPGAAPDAFSPTAQASARARMRIGLGRAGTFLSGLPGLPTLGSGTGSTGGTARRPEAGAFSPELRQMRILARQYRMPGDEP